MKSTKRGYGPNKRSYFEHKPQQNKAYCIHDSIRDSTLIPDPSRDPIVANNISNVEFDYTCQLPLP